MSALRKKAEAILQAGDKAGEILETGDLEILARAAIRFEEVSEEFLACQQCLRTARRDLTETLTQRRILQIMIETLAMTPIEEQEAMLNSIVERSRALR